AEKGFHVCLFLILGVVLSRISGSSIRNSPGLVLLIAFAIGVSSEAFQALFPDRDPTLRDVMINFFGSTLGVAMSALLQWRAGFGNSNPCLQSGTEPRP